MPDKTISQLENEGYTGILCTCRDQACRNRVAYPFRLIRLERPKLMLSAMTVAELGQKMPCGKCGTRNVSYAPHRQSDAPGFAKSF